MRITASSKKIKHVDPFYCKTVKMLAWIGPPKFDYIMQYCYTEIQRRTTKFMCISNEMVVVFLNNNSVG